MVFTKIVGTGNDFIVVDNLSGSPLALSSGEIKGLCARRVGVGADGMLFLQKPKKEGAHFGMQYFNADGHEVEMCGNGACALSFFYHELMGGEGVGDYTFETQNGTYWSQVRGDRVKLQMMEISQAGAIEIGDLVDAKFSYYINTGVPHCVYEVENLADCPVGSWGSKVRWDQRFEQGANCNFFQQIGDYLHIRTFERGVEAETLACGTGVVAVALALYLRGDRREVYHCRVSGGEVMVQVESPHKVFFCGKVEKIFTGQLAL